METLNAYFEAHHRPLWAEIDLDCVRHNIQEFQRIIPQTTQIMAVVKADAYGHGAEHVAKAALQAGATRLAVALLEEAIVLRQHELMRQHELTVPIHILGVSAPGTEEAVIHHNIIPTICSLDSARRFSEAAQRTGKTLPVCVKLDTGMGRIGLRLEQLPDFLDHFTILPALTLEGVFSHFSKADEVDKAYTDRQIHTYVTGLELFQRAGLEPRIRCLANSAGTIDMPASTFDMVRIGISLYGLYPSQEVQMSRITLKPVMQWKTRIVHLKTLPAGESISYGGMFTTQRQTLVATLPVGYADGYRRKLWKTGGQVLVRGQRVPIIGRVCMDMCMIDVTDVAGVKEGDEVVLLGIQGDETITAEEIATQLDTINYEITCLVGKRVPRVYYDNGHITAISSLLGEKCA
jgi:alanine racemase